MAEGEAVVAELMRELFVVLADEPRGIPEPVAMDRLSSRVQRDPSGIVRRHAIYEATAGWLVMGDDRWWLTLTGRAALHGHRDAIGLHREAVRLWSMSTAPAIAPVPPEGVVSRSAETSDTVNPFGVAADPCDEGESSDDSSLEPTARTIEITLEGETARDFLDRLRNELVIERVSGRNDSEDDFEDPPSGRSLHLDPGTGVPTKRDHARLLEFVFTEEERERMSRDGLSLIAKEHVWPLVKPRTRQYLRMKWGVRLGYDNLWPQNEVPRRDVPEVIEGHMPARLACPRGRGQLSASQLLRERRQLRGWLRPRSLSDPAERLSADFFHFGERCDDVVTFLTRADEMTGEEAERAITALSGWHRKFPGGVTTNADDTYLRWVNRIVDDSLGRWAPRVLREGVVHGAHSLASGIDDGLARAIQRSWRDAIGIMRVSLPPEWDPPFGHRVWLVGMDLGPNADEFSEFYKRTERLTRQEVIATMNDYTCSSPELRFLSSRHYRRLRAAYLRVREVLDWPDAWNACTGLTRDYPERTRHAVRDAGLAILAEGLCSDSDRELLMLAWGRAESARSQQSLPADPGPRP